MTDLAWFGRLKPGDPVIWQYGGFVTKKTLRCPTCGFTVRRPLSELAGCRGVYETPAEPAWCPRGCGRIPDPASTGIQEKLAGGG